jgi:hypothetical protein
MMGFASLTGSNAATGSAAAAAALAERRRHELIAERQADRIFQVKKIANYVSKNRLESSVGRLGCINRMKSRRLVEHVKLTKGGSI